jgi:hypothetical protein
MKYATAVAVALLSGCTANNPNYIGGIDGGSDAGGLHLDGAARDLPSAPDLSTPKCTDGERHCANGGSEICINGVFTTDRTCPSMSMCSQGYCQPPPMSTDSQLGADCAMQMFLDSGPQENQCLQNLADNLSCEPFFDPTAGGIVWRCDKMIGAGLPATPCTMGSQCRSGFCGSNGTCFRACQGDQDCPQNGGAPVGCKNVMIVVEGQAVTAGSCTPN